MRRFDRRIAIGVGIIGVLCLLWLLITGGLIWSVLAQSDRMAVQAAVGPRAFLLIMMWAVSLVVVAVVLQRLIAYFMTAPARLAEEAQVLLGTDVNRKLHPTGSPENRRLTAVINQLVDQREELRTQMNERVKEASRNTELEKSRLAALMSELTKSVVVCNLDGRILLYNNRARSLFRALSKSPVAGGLELIGLGRSIYGVLEEKSVSHALENIQHRLQGGISHPSAQFVTTTQSGQLLRVQMTPVRAVNEATTAVGDSGAQSSIDAELESKQHSKSQEQEHSNVEDNEHAKEVVAPPQLTGFVLLVENITNDFETDSAKDRMLFSLTEGSRAGLANAQAAVEVLEYPDIGPEMRDRLLGVIREEIQGLSKRVDELQESSTHNLRSRWPLEDMVGSDLLAAAARRIEASLPVKVVLDETDTELWLKVESFSLLQALVHLAKRIHEEYNVCTVHLRLGEADSRATLDLVWSAPQMNTQGLLNWDKEQIQVGDETLSLTIHDVVSRHDGAFWFEREENNQECVFFRLLLPIADPQEAMSAEDSLHTESRPEYYDFDLFKTTPQTSSFDDCLLSELSYTVFDTETTGLDPAGGDEILQMGAVRIVNGKLLQQETFDQLVDPKRNIPALGIPIHGITPNMVVGQPEITLVLPAFHAFAKDTVLVAHNAAFDMRCLQVKEEITGLVFDQPVMDTLLLSAVVHPQQESHQLEAIAERFNVTVVGRHTALGDAMVTAEVFLQLIPLLAEQGIFTVGQAREAAQKTFYARLKY